MTKRIYISKRDKIDKLIDSLDVESMMRKTIIVKKDFKLGKSNQTIVSDNSK